MSAFVVQRPFNPPAVMPRRLWAVLLSTLLVALGLALAGCDQEAKALKETNAAFDRAIDSLDGDGAAAFLSTESVSRATTLLRHAATMTKEQVQSLPLGDRLEILIMRARLTPKQMRELDGRGYFALAVRSQWLGSTSDAGRTAVKINSRGTEGTITLYRKGNPIPLEGHFVKENGQWKCNNGVTRASTIRDIASGARENGMTENQYLLAVVRRFVNSEVTETLWDRPRG